MLVPALASSSRRTASTQGPVAFTTARVRMVISSPAAVRTSTPVVVPSRTSSPTTSQRVAMVAPQAAAARATATTRRASSV